MADIKKFAEELVNLSVKDVQELAKVLKEEYGIEPAAAAVAVAGPAAAGAGAALGAAAGAALGAAGAAARTGALPAPPSSTVTSYTVPFTVIV